MSVPVFVLDGINYKTSMALSFFRQLQKRDRNFDIEIDGVLLPVQVKENDRAKRITLRLSPNGDVAKVTTPGHVSDDAIEEFVHRNRNWLATRIALLPERIELQHGAVIPFKGIEHLIISNGKTRGLVKVTEHEGQPCLEVPGERESTSRKLLAFLKREARKELDRVVNIHCAKIGVRAKHLRITDTTSRWGSCSTTRTLSFSWRIIMAPPEVLNYLAAHEVAHLREMNHSADFWALTKELCPDTDIQKGWLRANGGKLHAVAA